MEDNIVSAMLRVEYSVNRQLHAFCSANGFYYSKFVQKTLDEQLSHLDDIDNFILKERRDYSTMKIVKSCDIHFPLSVRNDIRKRALALKINSSTYISEILRYSLDKLQ